MKDVGQRTAEATALKHAVPYIRIFKGKTFVLKAGGGALEREAATRALVEQVEVLHQVGIRVVLVHGGGTQSTELVPALGVSGVDAGLIQARKRPPVRVGDELVDYGFVGDIAGVDPEVLLSLLDAGYVPVVSPLSAADDGTLLNINADTVASALAVALKAEKLLFLTGAAGILERADDPGSLVSYTDLAGLRRLKDEGGLLRGMLPKTSAIEAAIQGGVRRVHILSHDLPDGLLAEVFTNEGVGTLVVEDVRVLSPAEAAAGAAP